MNIITKETITSISYISNLSCVEDIILEKSKDEKNIIRVKKDDKVVYLGSKYSVVRDINNFIEKIKELNTETLFFIFGLGTGEHIVELLKITGGYNNIIVIEPNINIVKLFTQLEYSDQILNNEKISVYHYNKDNLGIIIEAFVNIMNVNNIEYISFANYDKLYAEEFEDLTLKLTKSMNDKILDLNTAISFSDKYFNCYVKNIRTIVRSSFINSLKDIFKGLPAIIVSAGPSLDKNIHFLKEVQDKFIIIAGGRTLKTLLDIDVRPDFVCSIDPGEPSYIIMKDVLECDVPLVYNELSNFKVVEQYSGDKIYFTDLYLEEVTGEVLGRKADRLFQGGSVAHICTSFAAYLGCTTIAFIGQDLAYTNNQYHAKIAEANISQNIWDPERKGIIKELFGDKAKSNNSQVNNIIMVDDVFGGKVATSYNLNFYRELLEQFVRETPSVEFVNCTEGGANIFGTKVMNLSDFIKEFDNEIDKDIRPLLDKSNGLDILKVRKKLVDMSNALKEVKKKCLKGIDYSERMHDHYEGKKKQDIDYINIELAKIDKFIKKNTEHVNFIKVILDPEIIRVLMDYQYKEKFGESESDRGKRVALKAKNIYKGIAEGIEKTLPSILETISKFDD